MSLEQAIKDLTAAVEANTAALSGGASKPASKPASGGTTKKTTTAKKTTKPKGPTADDMASKFGEYMNVEDTDERKERKGNVKKILAHFEADRVTSIDPDNFVEAMAMLEKLEEGEDPFEDGEDEDDDSLM